MRLSPPSAWASLMSSVLASSTRRRVLRRLQQKRCEHSSSSTVAPLQSRSSLSHLLSIFSSPSFFYLFYLLSLLFLFFKFSLLRLSTSLPLDPSPFPFQSHAGISMQGCACALFKKGMEPKAALCDQHCHEQLQRLPIVKGSGLQAWKLGIVLLTATTRVAIMQSSGVTTTTAVISLAWQLSKYMCR